LMDWFYKFKIKSKGLIMKLQAVGHMPMELIHGNF